MEEGERAQGSATSIVSAQTGSGKTVAFGLAIASDFAGPDGRLPARHGRSRLVIAPTRELALQVSRELDLALWQGRRAHRHLRRRHGCRRKERRALGYGAQIVVGTPGRLRDHLERGALDLSGARGHHPR